MLTKKISFYVGMLGLFVGTFFLYYISHPTPPGNYKTLPPVNPYPKAIAASGIVEAANENISIGVPTGALVSNLYVKVWDRVKAGQPLFSLDDRDLQAQLQIQKANVAIAESQLARLKDQLERLKSVKDPRSVSQEDLKTKIHDVTIAEAQLKAAEAQVQNTQALIDRLTIRAPKDGIIMQSNIRPGEYISLNAESAPMMLGDLDHLQIRVNVDEENAYKVDGKAAAVAYPKNNATFSFPLHFIRIEPYVIPKRSLTGSSAERVDTRVLQVIYTFEQPKDFKLYAGQQVDVFIDDVKGH